MPHDTDTSCQCDRRAWSLGRPFCGYCGRRLCAPVLCIEDGVPLRPDAPLPWPAPERAGQDAELVLKLGKLPKVSAGWLDSALLVNEFGIPQIKSARLSHGALNLELETRVANHALTIKVPRPAGEDEFQQPALLSLYFQLSGMATGQQFCYRIALQSGAQLQIESDDPRVERGTAVPTLVFFSNRAGLPPISLRLAGPQSFLNAAESVRLERTGTQREAVLAVRNEAGALRLSIAGEVLANLLGADESAPLRLIVSSARGSVGTELECVRRSFPVLAFRSTVLGPFDFKADDENWCADGLARPLIVGDLQHWLPNYELAIEAADTPELLEAAEFSIEPSGGEDILRGAELKLVARVRPAWLYRSDLCMKSWRREGRVRLVLRNRLNESRGAPSSIDFGTLSVALAGAARKKLFALAVDFGTSNTSSAVLADEFLTEGEPIRLADGAITPTLLYYLQLSKQDVAEQQILVGREALSQNILRHDDVLFRRGLKTALLERALDEANGVAQKVKLTENVEFSIDQITEHFFSGYFKKIVASRLVDGRKVQTLLFTYPVTSPEKYRDTLHSAMERASQRLGFQFYESMQQACDEASAGGLRWFCKHRAELAARESVTLMVYDYGGGTTDISVLEFKNLGGGARWTVNIRGVAGVTRAGGDDLTWRLAREFARCVVNKRTYQTALPAALGFDAPLGRKLATLQDCEGRRRWWDNFPGLIKMMEQYKPETVGAKVVTNVPDAVIADLLEGETSLFIGPEFDVHEKSIRPHPGRSQTGQYALHVYNDWQADSRQLLALRDASSEMLLGHCSWSFDVGAREDGLLFEAEQAIEIARNMVGNLFGEAKKVDHLLLIGQASHAVYFRERLKNVLSDSYTLMTAAEADAKVCVAAGACDFHKFDRSESIDLVNTILKRIVLFYEEGMSGRMRLQELMSSSTERNRGVRLNAAAAQLIRAKPHRFSYYIDATYSDNPNFASELKLKQELVPLHKGFAKSDKDIVALVADPGDAESFQDMERVPTAVQALIRKCIVEKPAFAHGWFFCFWPQGDPRDAWILEYTL